MKRLLILAALVAWANTASAAIFVSLIGIVPQSSPGLWTWSYGLFLQPDEVMRVNDFVTIYDFPNPLAAQFGISTAPEVQNPAPRTFLTTIQNTGVNPPQTGNPDLGTVPNITVTLTGGSDIVPNGPGPTIVGNLFVTTNTNAFTEGTYAASAAKRVVDPNDPTKFIAGDPVSNGSFVSIPIPEPGSALLLLAGLVAMGAVGLHRRAADR